MFGAFHHFAFEGRARSSQDAHTHGLSNAVISARDDDHLVLFGAAEEFFATALAHPFKENVGFASHPSLVGFERKFILKLNHLIKAANLGLFGDVVVEIAEGISAWTFRIFEHER